MVPLKSGSDNAKQNSNNELPISIKRGTCSNIFLVHFFKNKIRNFFFYNQWSKCLCKLVIYTTKLSKW